MVLLLAVSLPIAISISYFQGTPSGSTGNLQIQTATSSVTPGQASDTPRPTQVTKTVRNAEPAQGNNCTYPADHWLASTENWPAEVKIGSLYYTQEQAIEFVTTQPSQVFNVLFIQLHSAYLNIISGASQSQIVEPMLEASDWLNKTLYGRDNAKHGQERALELARTIQAYNDGEIGPGRCAAYATPSGLFNNKISIAVLSLTPDISLEAGQTTEPYLQTPTRAVRTPASGPPIAFATATSTPTRRSNSDPAPIPHTLIPTVRPSATQAPPTAQPTSPPPTSPPPTNTPRPVEPTPTSAPPEESTPTSPPP
jgi:hypothetical protein